MLLETILLQIFGWWRRAHIGWHNLNNSTSFEINSFDSTDQYIYLFQFECVTYWSGYTSITSIFHQQQLSSQFVNGYKLIFYFCDQIIAAIIQSRFRLNCPIASVNCMHICLHFIMIWTFWISRIHELVYEPAQEKLTVTDDCWDSTPAHQCLRVSCIGIDNHTDKFQLVAANRRNIYPNFFSFSLSLTHPSISAHYFWFAEEKFHVIRTCLVFTPHSKRIFVIVQRIHRHRANELKFKFSFSNGKLVK